MANRALSGGKGREDLPHNDDPSSPGSVMRDFGCQTIGDRYVIRTLRSGPMGLATSPVSDRPAQNGISSRSYGAAAFT